MPLPTVDLPLLSGQAAIWAAEQFGAPGEPYNLRFSVAYPRPEVGPERARAAIGALFELHPAFHGRIVAERGEPFARYDRSPSILEHQGTDPTGSRTAGRLLHPDQAGMDTSEGAADVHLVTAAECVHVVFELHHVLFDGSARAILLEDLDALVRGETPRDPHGHEDTVREALELEHGARHLASQRADGLAGQVSATRWAPATTDGHDLHATTVSGLGAALRERRGLGGRPAEAFAFAAAEALTHHVAPPPLIGMAMSTRPDPSTRCVGCFVNTGLLVPPADGWRDTAATGAELRRAFPYRHTAVAAVAIAARRAAVPIDFAQIPLLSISNLASSGTLSTVQSPGHRPGPLTWRLWLVNQDATIGIDHDLGLCPAAEGDAMNARLARTLERLTAEGSEDS